MPNSLMVKTVNRARVSAEAIRSGLWCESVGADAYTPERAAYQSTILEQYRLYAEMADRVSARRSLANTFFLTSNSIVFTALSIYAQVGLHLARTVLILPTLLLIVQCGAWYAIIRSYRQLSSAKYRVIGALEERLPASPYWGAEWSALGSGRDKSLYVPMTRVEQVVPVLFAIAYAIALVMTLI